jgi:hypothetical protein
MISRDAAALLAALHSEPVGHAASTDFSKRRCAELLERMPVPVKAFHWQPVRTTQKTAPMVDLSQTRGYDSPMDAACA